MNYIPTWRRLRRYGGNKIVKSSYIWVIAVPIAAKLIPEAEKLLSLNGVNIVLSLPFSWQMFYLGSVFFAFSSIIYSTKCPHLIQRYSIPGDYWDSGHGLRELNMYAKVTLKEIDKSDDCELLREYMNVTAEHTSAGTHDEKGNKNSKFFFLQEKTQHKKIAWRALCALGYAVGMCFFAIVLVQNFIFVVRTMG